MEKVDECESEYTQDYAMDSHSQYEGSIEPNKHSKTVSTPVDTWDSDKSLEQIQPIFKIEKLERQRSKLKHNYGTFLTSSHEGRMVGFYTQRERLERIKKWRKKGVVFKRKLKLIGRSTVARNKIRHNGRFYPMDDIE